MNQSCIIIEDQLPAQRILKRYIEDVPELTLLNTFTDPLSALAFMQKEKVNLIFLDIHLPKISGMDFLKILPYKPKVILTTAFSEYAIEGYEFDVVDYLLKPISFERFMKAISKVIYQTERSEPATKGIANDSDHYIFVKSDRTIVKIDTTTIIYIKADSDFTRVITSDKNYFLSYPLKYWQEVLPRNNFCRVHKSYIVNLNHVDQIEGNQIVTSKEKLPIGRSFKEDFMQRIDLS
ncbi:MAG: LytR/AlgR family response regulator transcription factor [Cyclobacteriaceae bacterium]